MNLKHLTDKTLLNDTKALIVREREHLTKILHHLKEIDRRKLYSDLGFSSLYDYCTKELGYSNGSAYRRIEAARLIEVVPEIEEKIESGLLNLMNISQASQFFNQNDVDNPEDKKAILSQLENLSKSEGDKMLLALSGEDEKPTKEGKRRVTKDLTRVSVLLTDEQLDRCNYLMGLIGKKMTYQDLIEYMVAIAIADVEKRKFKVLSYAKDSLPPVGVKRVIKASTKGEVFRRDQKCVKCGSTRNLNFDHQIPFALGGKSEDSNVRLLCFNCNQRARIRAKL